MIIHDYENYGEPKFLNDKIWHSYTDYYTQSLYLDRWHIPKFYKMRMVQDRTLFDNLTDKCTIEQLKHYPVFDLKHYVFQNNDSLFFDPACNIPRYSGASMYKRVIKLEKADAVVIPPPKPIERYKYCAVFKDDTTILVIRNYDDMSVAPAIGDTIYDMFEKNKANINKKIYAEYGTSYKYGNARCIYLGAVVCYPKDDEFIFKVLDGTYRKVIFEDDLMNDISTAGSRFDYDTVQHLLTMLRSSDDESRHLALRTLTAMDYMHYPAVTNYILRETNNCWRELNLPSSVQYMMTNVKYSFYNNPFESVLPSEFDLARLLYIDYLKGQVDDMIRKQDTKLKISCTVNIDITQ